jgi:uncharacterized OB-fold protein
MMLKRGEIIMRDLNLLVLARMIERGENVKAVWREVKRRKRELTVMLYLSKQGKL